jgi:hypothetical protein
MTDARLPLSVPLPTPLQQAIETYDVWSQRHLLEVQEKEIVDRPLYQYTNSAGLRGIFDSQKMWFTDYRFLNDPSELSHGMDMARDMLLDAQNGLDGRVRFFLKCAADMFCRENVEATLAFFVASFSRARDDLGQWRAYADNGRGFAVGFAPRMFRIKGEANPSPDENAFLGSVLYDVGDVLSRHRLAIDEAIEIFRTAVDAQASLMADRAIGIAFIQEFSRHLIASPLIWNALTSKHPAYKHEQEVRLLMMGTTDMLAPFIMTRSRGTEIVPYIPYPWNVREPGAIVEVLVGPAAPHGAEDAVRVMLATYGLKDVAIERSEIPYRAPRGSTQ